MHNNKMIFGHAMNVLTKSQMFTTAINEANNIRANFWLFIRFIVLIFLLSLSVFQYYSVLCVSGNWTQKEYD